MKQIDNSQRVCPEKVRTKLDPFTRDEEGNAYTLRSTKMSPEFAAMLEFLIQVPLPERTVKPAIMSLCTTSDHFLIGNGDFFGSSDDLERNLRDWCRATGLAAGYETESFQAMIDANMGVPSMCHRVTI